MSEKHFEDEEQGDQNFRTKTRGPHLISDAKKNSATEEIQSTYESNETSQADERKRAVSKEKARIKKKILDICENLELGQAKDVADLPVIQDLCELLKELAIQSELRLDDNIQQGNLTFTNLIKLLEEHRYYGCNIQICFKVINCLLKLSGYDTDQLFSCIDACKSQVELLKELGSLFLAQAQIEKSILIAEQLATITNKLGEHKLEAEAYLILLKSNFQKGSLDGTQRNLDKYLECSAKTGDALSKGYAAMASAYVSLLSQKDEEALKQAEEFLEVARSLENKRVECEALLFLASNHAHLFNMQKSLDFNLKGLKIAQELHFMTVVKRTNLNLASDYIVMGKYAEAYDMYTNLKGQQNDFELQDELFNYTILTNLSVVALLLNKNVESLELAQGSLTIAQAIGGTGRRLAIAYGNIGLAKEKLKKYSDAIESFKKCLEHAQNSRDDRCINNGFCNLGRAYQGNGDKKTAREYYEKALASPQPPSAHWCDTEDFRFSADYLLAKLDVEEERNLSARKHLEQVVERCESFRKSVNDSPLKICFNDTQKKPYQLLQYVMLKEGANDEALLVSEKGRGRDFYDKFVRDEGEQSSYLNTPQNLLQLAKDKNEAVLFLSHLEDVKQMCIWFITPDGKIANKVFLSPHGPWEKELISLCVTMKEYDTLTKSKQQLDQVMAEDSPPATQTQWQVKSRGMKVNKEEVTEQQPPVSDVDLPTILKWFTEVVDNLSTLVIRPIEHHLEKLIMESKEKPQLLIISQGMSFNIPYTALKFKDGKPLCSRVSTHEAFSFHAYLHCMKLNQEPTDDLKKVLIIGNPTKDLPFAKKEAETIADQLGVPPEARMIGPSATRSLVVSRLPHASSLVHFACHGSPDGRMLSLAPEASNTESYLTAEEISRLPITAKLVVLSACHTSRGKLSSEGVLGLARAFLIAGAKSVVTAVWALPDKPTKSFMEKFYNNLGKMPVCDTLSATMYEMSEDESFKHVVNWGSFKILGANVRMSFSKT